MGCQIEKIGIVLARPTKNYTSNEYIDNRRFLPKKLNFKNDIFRYDPFLGLVSTVPYEYDRTEYKTIFGPSFAHSGKWYRNDRLSLCGAIRRLTCSREPTTIGLHEELTENQYKNVTIENNTDYIDRFRGLLRGIQVPMSESGRHDWSITRHAKQKERINTLRSVYGNGRQADPDWCPKVVYKMKTFEILPEGKYSRAIGDLACPASCKGAYLMPAVKKVFAVPYSYKNGLCQFYGSPSNECMIDVFSKLIDPYLTDHDVFFPFFSDDSCISAKSSDGILKANCDIKSCDGSIFAPIFIILFMCMICGFDSDQDIQSLFNQCTKDIIIRDPLQKSSNILVLYNQLIALFSGSALTTSVNNLANTLIFRQFMNKYSKNFTIEQNKKLLVEAAYEVGFILKIDQVHTFADFQFLKCSPAYDINNNLRSYVNLGVWLRSFGSCDYDLPGRHKDGIDNRVKRFRSDVALGCYNWGNHSLNRAFQKFIISKTRFYPYKNDFDQWMVDKNQYYLQDENICIRYGITQHELLDLCDYISSSNTGDMIHHPIVDIIMAKDYGYNH